MKAMPEWSASPMGFYGLGTSKSWMFLWDLLVFRLGAVLWLLKLVVLVVYSENDPNIFAQDNKTEFVCLFVVI